MTFSISVLFEIIAFLSSIFFFIRKKNSLISSFIPFLFVTVVVEFLGWLWSVNGGSQYKYVMYNFFIPLEIIFYSTLFHRYLRKPLFKKIVILLVPVFLAMATINMIFIQGVNHTFNSYTALLGAFIIVIFCCLFFYESVLPDQMDQQLLKQPFFWVTSGLLIFYLGSVIANALFEYLKSNDLQEQSKRIYVIIFDSLNVILYSSFCLAFYLCPSKKKIYL